MARLQDVFQSHAIVKILDFLALYKDFEYTRTDIAKETGISRRTLYEVFPILEKYELVTLTKTLGKIKLYKLNTENSIAKYLVLLIDEIAFFKAEKITGIELTEKNQSSKEIQSCDFELTSFNMQYTSRKSTDYPRGEMTDGSLSGLKKNISIPVMNSTKNDFPESDIKKIIEAINKK